MALLEVEGLRSYFFTRWGVVKAVDGVSFHLDKGETLGLVGESGCGKSATAFSLIRMLPEPAGKTVGGRILFDGQDILQKSPDQMRRFRGKHITMILQDPMTSLDPVFTVGKQISETVQSHQAMRGTALWRRVVESLRLVEISSPELRARHFPHQLSGGMRQRVVGAIAISCEPQLLIADEPTTSLDVTVQLQYLKLLKDIQDRAGLAILFITHDFGIVANMCDRVAVMYAGRIVETGPVAETFNSPMHPYTKALLRSIPSVEQKVDKLGSIPGEPPALFALRPGCAFQARCDERSSECAEKFPPEIDTGMHRKASCWRLA